MSTTNQSPETVLRQIDAIMEELQTLRQTVQVLLQAESSPKPPAKGRKSLTIMTISSDGTVEYHESLPESYRPMNPERISAWDIIQAAPGQRQFLTAEDVAQYLREERSAWED